MKGQRGFPKKRLIKYDLHDSGDDGLGVTRTQMFIKKIAKTGKQKSNLVFASIAAFVLIFIITTPVHAGFFSKIGELFGLESEVLVYERPDYSGNMEGLLSPALTLDPKDAQGGSEINIEDDALRAVLGPQGSNSDSDFVRPDSDQIYLYKVREGDTLSQIAERFGVRTNTIRWANNIGHNDVIRIDQVLTILPISGVQLTVAKGDTLASLAKKYGGDAEEIANYNVLDPSKALAVGSTIIIPGGELHTPAPAKKTSSSSKKSFNTSAPGVGSLARANSVSYIAPVTGCVLTQGIHSKNAVDIGCPTGTPIYAPAGGTVLIARSSGWNGGYGNYIVIKHNDGTQSVLAHQSRLAVGAGERVVQGQIVGYVGSSGNSTGPHLHFEHRGAARNYMAR